MLSMKTVSTPQTKPELFCFAILKTSNQTSPILQRVKSRMITAFENHEQDLQELLNALNNFLLECSSKKEKDVLTNIIHTFQTVNLKYSFEKRFENPLHRRYESELGIEFCFNPTTAMLKSVEQVSKGFIFLLENNSSEYFASSFQHFYGEGDRPLADGFGFFVERPSVHEVIEILRGNKKEDFARILMMHSELMWDLKRIKDVSQLHLPERKNPPSKQFAKYLSTRIAPQENFSDFLKKPHAKNEFSMFSDNYIYEKPIYSDRGRSVTTQQVEECKPHCALGLMLPEQDRKDFMQLAKEKNLLAWKADVTFQRPNPQSQFVNQLLEVDSIYISGSSGWSSLYLGAMEMVGNLPSDMDRYNYFWSYICYMLAGGLHSISEVMIPTAATLELIPHYRPHQHQILFNLFKDDVEFVNRYENVWNRFINHFVGNYFHVKKNVDSLKTFSLFNSENVTTASNEISNTTEFKL